MCDAVAPVPEDPSPKSHAYEATVPSGSDDPEPSTFAVRSLTADVNDAVGGRFAGAVTVTTAVAESAAPPLSVAVSATV